MNTLYKDRKEAGIALATHLLNYKDKKDVIVLALPRGGVVVGYEVARLLNCPLDIIIVRKIGFPGQPELAIGAVAETGDVVLNEDLLSVYNIPQSYIEKEISANLQEILRRITLYRKGKEISPFEGKNIILIDDGIATGATIKVAIAVIKKKKIARLIVAVPVASISSETEIKGIVDELVCPESPRDFMAIGNYYEDFTQVSDNEVTELLSARAHELHNNN